MESSRQAGDGEVSPALVAEGAEIERNARAALAAVEAVISQAEASRRAVELVLTKVAELGAELGDGQEPSTAINDGAISQGVRVLAVQLVAAGASRDEVSERLRDQLGIEDTGELLDAIYRRRGDAQ